jgi:hypothetical protein
MIEETILKNDLYWAQSASTGAMGFAGTIDLFLMENGTLVKRTISIREEEDLYCDMYDWLRKHSDNYMYYLALCRRHQEAPRFKRDPDINLDEMFFDSFDAGFGNSAYFKTGIDYSISGTTLSFTVNGVEHQLEIFLSPVAERLRELMG